MTWSAEEIECGCVQAMEQALAACAPAQDKGDDMEDVGTGSACTLAAAVQATCHAVEAQVRLIPGPASWQPDDSFQR